MGRRRRSGRWLGRMGRDVSETEGSPVHGWRAPSHRVLTRVALLEGAGERSQAVLGGGREIWEMRPVFEQLPRAIC